MSRSSCTSTSRGGQEELAMSNSSGTSAPTASKSGMRQNRLQSTGKNNDAKIPVAVHNIHKIGNVRDSSDHRPTPIQTLLTHKIKSDTTTVIIGDSVLSLMRAEKMATSPSDKVQIISVPGLQARDVLAWLEQQPVCSHIQLVTIHAGVNDCQRSQVTSRTWDHILDACEYVFPMAGIQMSSVIPARGRLPINQCIFSTNRNLQRVCNRRCVKFIDNDHTFTSTRGAPRKAFYRMQAGDFVHPSLRGVIALAGNFKRANQCRETSTTDQQDWPTDHFYNHCPTFPPPPFNPSNIFYPHWLAYDQHWPPL